MNEINLSKTILNKRKEKGVTQDELAAFIGVSKSSVSKWETGQSYPDISFLPQIASYFNISIDMLMDYRPQIQVEQIRLLHKELTIDFSSKPFDEVIEKCDGLIKKYYSCFTFLFEMSALLINYSNLAKDEKQKEETIKKAKSILIRIKTQSMDMKLCKQAIHVEAIVCIMLSDPQAAIDLLNDVRDPYLYSENAVSLAYQMMGEIEKSKEVMQINMYQHLFGVIQGFINYIVISYDDERFEIIAKQLLELCDLFNVHKLHPYVMFSVYLVLAQGYAHLGETEKVLKYLLKYAQIATEDNCNSVLHGDDLFNLIDNWFDELTLGTSPAKDINTIKNQIVQGLVENPYFTKLTDDQIYKSIVSQIKAKLGVK